MHYLSEYAEVSLYQASLGDHAMALMMGSEGSGLRKHFFL